MNEIFFALYSVGGIFVQGMDVWSFVLSTANFVAVDPHSLLWGGERPILCAVGL